MTAYSLESWKRLKQFGGRADNTPVRLADIPADAEMDAGVVLGCWNGERFVSWEKWIATAPTRRETDPEAPAIALDAVSVNGRCDITPHADRDSLAKIRRQRGAPSPAQLPLLEPVDEGLTTYKSEQET